MEGETSATVAVVRAVAEAEDESPGDLPLLSDVIDPEAFDAMFDDDRPGRSGVSLSFDYCGYVVTITDDAVALDVR
ncbi:HalOD1 output domain-containing protein [Halorubrum sp. N11]|uniref:HalOD1 output domain-containing protein n=1 Tax=Halorubrum sp. N11 TaxID=3402276 RepID=UPI003EBE09C1